METTLRLRLGTQDAHYGGDLVDGARVLALFGDAATALLVMHDGDEGLFRAYTSVDFLAPVRAGDFLEIRARIVKVGATSRTIDFVAEKYVEAQPAAGPSAARALPEPLVVVRATGVCVVPRERLRARTDTSAEGAPAEG